MRGKPAAECTEMEQGSEVPPDERRGPDPQECEGIAHRQLHGGITVYQCIEIRQAKGTCSLAHPFAKHTCNSGNRDTGSARVGKDSVDRFPLKCLDIERSFSGEDEVGLPEMIVKTESIHDNFYPRAKDPAAEENDCRTQSACSACPGEPARVAPAIAGGDPGEEIQRPIEGNDVFGPQSFLGTIDCRGAPGTGQGILHVDGRDDLGTEWQEVFAVDARKIGQRHAAPRERIPATIKKPDTQRFSHPCTGIIGCAPAQTKDNPGRSGSDGSEKELAHAERCGPAGVAFLQRDHSET